VGSLSPTTAHCPRALEEEAGEVNPVWVVGGQEERGPGGAGGHAGVRPCVQARREEEVRAAGKLALHVPLFPFPLGLPTEEIPGSHR